MQQQLIQNNVGKSQEEIESAIDERVKAGKDQYYSRSEMKGLKTTEAMQNPEISLAGMAKGPEGILTEIWKLLQRFLDEGIITKKDEKG